MPGVHVHERHGRDWVIRAGLYDPMIGFWVGAAIDCELQLPTG